MEIIHENPFVGFGQPVTTPRLIGQENLIQKLQQNLLNGSSVSLVGLPRSGKTSVAKEVLKRIESERSDISCATIFLSAVTDESDFYYDIAHDLFPDSDIFGEENDFGKRFDLFKDYLKEQGEKGFFGIVVIDEFDSVLSNKFTDPFLFIHQLCALIGNHDQYHLTFLLVSSRSLLHFTNSNTSESGVVNLCPLFCMKMFDRPQIESFLQRFNLNQSQIQDTLFQITGGQPFLTEALLYYAFDYATEKQLPLSSELIKTVRQQENCSAVFSQYYLKIKDFLDLWKNVQLWEDLCDMVVGPLLQQPTQASGEILKHYDLIDENNQCFSENFYEFLEKQVRSIPLWDSISDIETLLRKLVKTIFEKEHGQDWVTSLMNSDMENDQFFYKDKFHSMQETMIREHISIVERPDILAFSHLGDIQEIILHSWGLFQQVFKDSRKDFNTRMEIICNVRNSVAHNRPPKYIDEEKQILARKACEMLRKQICQWEENRKSIQNEKTVESSL